MRVDELVQLIRCFLLAFNPHGADASASRCAPPAHRMHAHARSRRQRRFVLLSTKVLESVHQVELGLNINSLALLEVGTALWSTPGTACRRWCDCPMQ